MTSQKKRTRLQHFSGRKIPALFLLFLFLAGTGSIFAQVDASGGDEESPASGERAQPVPYASGEEFNRELTLKEVVHLVLDNNTLVRLQQMEILKSDTELKKSNSKYAPKASFSYSGYEKKEKYTPSTMFTGTKTNQDVFKAGVDKLFSSGTYVGLQVSDTRLDTNAGEGNSAYMNSFASMLAQDPLHKGAITLTLRQELLKNAFGYSQRRLDQIAENNSAIQREDLTYQLSQLVVKAMVDYWSLAIAEEQVQTREMLLKNTRNLRNITVRKTRLGLAEAFEVNQWNALTAAAESELQRAILNRDNVRRELLRTMNLNPELKLTGATRLLEEIPEGIDVEKDIQTAYDTRPDLKNLVLQRKNARLGSELAENALLPSVSVAGQYAFNDQGRHANNAFYEAHTGKYHEASVELKVEYPLWDEGAEVDARNARISLQQIDIQEEQLRRQIHDDIMQGYDSIQASHEILQKTKFSLEQTEAFYRRLVTRYSQGRFTAEAVKNALDSLVQARLGLLQARVNFNVSLIQYDMVRNMIWNKFDVDVDQVIDRLAPAS